MRGPDGPRRTTRGEFWGAMGQREDPKQVKISSNFAWTRDYTSPAHAFHSQSLALGGARGIAPRINWITSLPVEKIVGTLHSASRHTLESAEGKG